MRPLEGSVESVLGKKVQGAKGEDLGRVVDVLADDGGHVRAAVIEFGGFLGVGNRRIAVDWSLLRFHPEDESHALVLGRGREDPAVGAGIQELHPPAGIDGTETTDVAASSRRGNPAERCARQ